jgi:hypothetical protein
VEPKLRLLIVFFLTALAGCSTISRSPEGTKQTKVSFALGSRVGVIAYDEPIGCAGKSPVPPATDIYIDGATYFSFAVATGQVVMTTGLGYATQWVAFTIPPGTGDLRISASLGGSSSQTFLTAVERKQPNGEWKRDNNIIQRAPTIPILGTGDWCKPSAEIQKPMR